MFLGDVLNRSITLIHKYNAAGIKIKEKDQKYVVPELRLTAAHSPQEAYDALGDWLMDLAADAPEPAATVAAMALKALPLLVEG